MANETLKTKAYEIIKENITTCKYAPGAVITEDFLQSELSVSRTPIREAINKLEQEGLVTVRPKKGIVIRPLTLEEASILYETRLLVEPYVIRTYGNCIPRSTYLDFYNSFSDLLASEKCDSDFELDDKLHQIFFNASGNAHLIDLNSRLSSQIMRLRICTRTQDKSYLAQTTKEHLAIIGACLQSEWEEAAVHCVAHLKESRKNSLRLILSNGLIG